jgi:hypothetical protein
MASVRIYIPAYRRPHLLRGALESLMAQTFRDWVAEVHNDDPADDFPGRLAKEISDPRLTCINHPRNLGATAAFNLFFQPATESFTSILEDDNVWEPDFLETMLAAAACHPDVDIFWANMTVRTENSDGTLTDAGRSLWPMPEQPGIRLMPWGDPRQSIGALHSNGAMLVRQRGGCDLTVPGVPLAFIEPVRERKLPHPIALVETPLARFTFTRTTARSDSRAEHLEMQTMLAATFLRHAPWHPGQLRDLWDWAASQSPPATAPLLLAACHTRKARVFWSRVRPSFVIRLAASLLARPTLLQALLRSRRVHAAWWDFLDTHTARRFQRPAP